MTDWTPERHEYAKKATESVPGPDYLDQEYHLRFVKDSLRDALAEIERLEAERDRVCGGHAGETFSAIDDWHYCPRCGKEIVSTDSAHEKVGKKP